MMAEIAVCKSQSGVGQWICGIVVDRLIEIRESFLETLGCELADVIGPPEVRFVRDGVNGARG